MLTSQSQLQALTPATGSAGQPHLCPPPRAHWNTQSMDEAAVVGNRAREYESHVFSLICFLYYSLTMYFF